MQRFEHENTDARQAMRRRALKRRRATPARRRDPYQPETISSNDSGFHVSLLSGNVGTTSLRPSRDAGLRLQSRTERRQAAERRRRRQWLMLGAGIVALLFVIAFSWMQLSNHAAARNPFGGLSALFTGRRGATTGSDAGAAPADDDADVTDGPTPIIASYKNMPIRLPVALDALTEVAFHPANYNYTVALETHMPTMSLDKAEKHKGTGRDISVQPAGSDALLVGSCLKMWRSGRATANMTAVDVGAAAGTQVLASVDGTVTSVRLYPYENKTKDYEIHIACNEAPGIELVMIHLRDVSVKKGDRVQAGITPVAKIRDIAKYVRNQLATYAGHKGNHVHIQLNDTRKPSYKARQKKLLEQNWYLQID